MSFRRITSAVLIPATLLLFTGCTKTVWIGPEQLQPEQKLKGVVTADGQEVQLEPAAATLRGDTIYADVNGETLRFALDDVQQVGALRSDALASVGLALSVVAAAFAVLVAIVAIECANGNCFSS